MNSKDLIREGRLLQARDQLTGDVKSSPADLGKRTLLFQVLCFCGEWTKAERHLDVIAAQDSTKQIGVQVYKYLIHGERQRTDVSSLVCRPSFLPEAPSYMEMHLGALKMLIDEKVEQAKELFDQIDAKRPVVSGTLDGKNFSSFKDTDAFLSLSLEAVVHEQYVWIPFEFIRELSISSPKTLFDLLWATARITTWEGLTMNCYLPVLYPDSFTHEDDRVKLGRMTDWVALGGPFSKGMGQHVYRIGEEEMPILEIREALFEPPMA